MTKLGPSLIRGVPVTGFALKSTRRRPRQSRALIEPRVEALAKSFGAAEIPVDVWVDGQNLVRREKLTLPLPGRVGRGGPARASP